MDTVIITGASGEPALSIARRLCAAGMRVYALAGTLPENAHREDELIHAPCDLTSPSAVAEVVKNILEKEKHIVGLILAGQYLSENNFECIPTEEIPPILNAQVVSPLCAVRTALPSLITNRGHVIVVSPGTGTTAGRALNAVADAATRAFAGTLFAELRDTGVKTCHILLQNNEGIPDPAARFTTTPQSRIHADIVADAVETVFKLRENNALTQMILRPQATRETPRIPVSSEPKIRTLQVVQLPPPKNFPPEEEPIPTPPYRRPEYAPPPKKRQESDEPEDDGTDENYVDPELRYLVKQPETKKRPSHPETHDATKPEAIDTKNKFESRNARRRRNRRNKNRNSDGAMRVKAPEMPGQNNAPEAPAKAPNSALPEKTGTSSDSSEAVAPTPETTSSPAGGIAPQAKDTQESSPVPAKKRLPKKPRTVKTAKPAPNSENPLPEKKKKPRLPRPPKAPKTETPPN